MSEHLRAAVADIDARLAVLQTEVQRHMDARGVLLKLMGEPVAAPAPAEVAEAPPAMEAARVEREKARVTPPARLTVTSSPVPRGGHDAHILKALQRGPVDLRTIAQAADLSRDAARMRLYPLIRDGKVVATGNTGSRRYSLPSNGNGRAAAQPPADSEDDARRRHVQPGESLMDARRRLDRAGA